MTAAAPTCSCGCGASLAGWSNAGAYRRANVRRVYRTAHGSCMYCGQPLSQYGECDQCV